MLGWPDNNRTGILVESLAGSIRVLSALCPTVRGVLFKNADRVPLALWTSRLTLGTSVSIRVQVVPSRLILAEPTPHTVVLPTVLTALVPPPRTLVADPATLNRWLNTTSAQHTPVTPETIRARIVRWQVPARPKAIRVPCPEPSNRLNKLIR